MLTLKMNLNAINDIISREKINKQNFPMIFKIIKNILKSKIVMEEIILHKFYPFSINFLISLSNQYSLFLIKVTATPLLPILPVLPIL